MGESESVVAGGFPGQDSGLTPKSWASTSGIERLWLLLPVFLLIYKGFIFPLPPLDFWWHLKMGEVIATTGSIPRADTFSFTAEGKPFVLQNWLGELLYYWTFETGGFPLLVFLGTALSVGGFLLTYRLCLEATPDRRIAALVGFVAALGNYGFLRPQTYSFLLFAAFYYVLSRYRDRRRDSLWVLPLLMILWVNLHGAFILGLALMGLYIVAESSRRLVDPENTRALSVLEIRKLVLTLALCGAATLANPEGIQLYDYVRTVVLDPGSQQLVAEWRPPRINDFLGFLLFYCPFLLGLLAFIHSRVRPDFTEMMLFFSFAILGLTAIRNAAWFSTITYPLLARYLPLVDLTGLMRLRRFKAIDRLFNSSGDPERESPRMRRVNGLVMAAAVLVLATQSPWLRPRLSGASLLMDQTPVGAADFIEQQGLTGRMFHSQVFGDYLMWRLWPQQKTFIDGRVHLFTMDFLRDYEATIEDPLATNVFAHWNIQYVLLHKTSGKTDGRAIRSMENSAAWKKIYEDEISVMFERIPASLG